ncbi:uncharacterized protein BO96DRAFT_352472 [Aspergillus niger CBS 101883]|uniref:Uncharacterized protein n=3 Tax=Aspergillus niger TaxID=5061 RepID=A2QSV8_ASPNC|nr:uncharacterized protein BO96DRAFT_352472 [Aspergillus niger CBS 101883]XP_059601271.1 hypothetical protein An08g12100 [Aspergillus niger]PYH50476.1 hypothetical protein BO96DRAFT_352472 [Aspergillus niger CBS 101883]RDH14179.1 hypothetical protein M747DRAFT_319728 [Aspergillus niger ATCC 13496]CAK40086.1 hypothetical protein An08g12100 [Aspergillus niger]
MVSVPTRCGDRSAWSQGVFTFIIGYDTYFDMFMNQSISNSGKTQPSRRISSIMISRGELGGGDLHPESAQIHSPRSHLLGQFDGSGVHDALVPMSDDTPK